MTETHQDLQQLLGELSGTPSGPARIALLEPAAERAEEEGAPAELRLRVLLDLAGEYGLQERNVPRLALFEQCRELADEIGDELPDELAQGLRWQQKQLIQKLVESPEIELKRIEVLEADYEGWLSRAGLGSHSVLGSRSERAVHRGDHDRARRRIEQWAASEPDAMSDCIACDAERQVTLLNQLGEPARATEVGLAAAEIQVDCRNQPHGLLAALSGPLAEQSASSLARVAHLRSYRVQRVNPNLNNRLSHHLLFCARTGLLQRGREMLERHLSIFGSEQSALQELRLCSAAAPLVDALAELDPSGTLALPAEPFGGPLPLPKASAALADRARQLAERFDARNGTKAVSKSVEQTLSAPALDYVPLLEQPATPEPEPHPAAASPEELLREVVAGVPEAHAQLPDVSSTEDGSVHRRALLALRRMWENDVPAAIDELSAVVGDLETNDDYALATWMRIRLARLLDERDDERLDEHLQILAERDPDLSEPSLWDAPLRVHGLLTKRDPERAATFAERIRPQLDDDGVLARLVLPILRAQEAFGNQDVEGAAQALQEGARAELDAEWPAQPQLYVREGSATMLAGLFIDAVQDAASAVAELDEIVAACDEHGVGIRPSLHLARARALLVAASGPPELEPFLLALRSCERSGSYDERAQARQWLAKAYLQHGREIEAAELLETGLVLSQDTLDDPVRLEIRFQLARIRRHLGEPAGAAELLEPLADEALNTSAMAPNTLGECITEATSTLWDIGEQERAAQLLDRGITWQRENGDRITLVALLQHRARMHNMSGQPDDAVTTLDTANDELASAGLEEQQQAALRALLDLDRSRSLVLSGKPEEALALLDDTEEAVAELPQQLIATRQRRVEVLLEVGRPADAEHPARELLSSLDEEGIQQYGADSARLLAQALDQQGEDWQRDEQLLPFLQG